MELETEYIEYGVELSLAMLGISASYFIDFNNPITFLGLIFLPILYGYTVYISRDGFNDASLVTLISLIFGVVGGLTALSAIAFSIGNILCSVFAGGDRFRDFYSTTSIPLLLTGLIIGASIYGYGVVNTDFKTQTINQAGEEVGSFAEKAFADSGLVQNQKDTQVRVINATSRSTAALMMQRVFNETDPSLEVRRSILDAQQDIPQLVYEKSVQNAEESSINISDRIQQTFTTTFAGSKFILVIPLITGFLYSLQPLFGLLTAIFGKIFSGLDG